MGGGKYLLLLPAFVLVVRCQQKPQVSLFPNLKQIFIGDFLKLSCNASPRESAVKWFLNGNIQNNTENILKIPVAAPKDSGSYQCESNGQKSENFPINVLEYHPIASLTLETGQPVMRKGSSVILKIENEDGLKGWNCWVTRGDRLGKIILNLQNDSVSLTFQANRLAHPDTIFWCTDKPQSCRSNQITVRTSDNTGALEMYPLPAVAGDSLTLKCLVWGTNKVSNAEFYKDGLRITSVLENTYEIKDVTESQVGKYKCHANYKYIDQTVATPHQLVSDDQEVLVQRRPVTPELSEGMLCSCPLCNKDMSPRLYKKDGQSWTLLNSNSEAYSPGTYRCRFVMKDMRTLLSNSVEYKLSSNLLMVVIIGMIVAALALFVLGFYFYKKRDTTEPIYQDVPLRSQGDAKYETLQKARGRESEYDTLNPEASGGERKDGEYEALKKEGMQEGLYHSLGAQGTPGGEGGYEALKKEGMQEGVYHSLGAPGTAGGEGAYEALKKEGMQEGVYHSLGAQGAAGEDGGYEALKKESIKDGEYQTLKTEQAVKKPDEELEIVES